MSDVTSDANSVSSVLAKARTATRRGAYAEAEALLRDVLERYPGNKSARDGLAALQRPDPTATKLTRGQLEAVIALFRKGAPERALAQAEALAPLAPDLPALLSIRAACLCALGRAEQAVPLYQRALGQTSGDASLWAGLGGALRDAQDLSGAEAAFAKAASLKPADPSHALALATTRHEMGHDDRALAAIDPLLAARPNHAAALNLRGLVLRHMGRFDLSRAAHEAAAQRGTTDDRAQAFNHLGVLATALGRPAAAATHYRAALRTRPRMAMAHRNLSRVTEYTAGDRHLSDMQALLHDRRLSDADRTQVHFALFKALDDTGDTNAAIEQLHQGNALQQKTLRHDPARDAALFAHIRQVSAAPLPVLTRMQGPRPVFITGLPRSGTSLTERILTGAPDVTGAGELQAVTRAISPVLKALQADQRAIGADDLQTFGAALRAELAKRADGKPVIIDKMPLNFRWIGPVLAALPEARVIHLQRPPMAVGWSLYRSLFATRGNGFAYDLDAIGRYIRLHDDLMQMWHAQFSDRILTLEYDALTADPETQSRRAVAHAGLTWNDACLNPHKRGTAMLTASAGQVTQPIYTGASEAWRRYGLHLTPLAEALQTPI